MNKKKRVIILILLLLTAISLSAFNEHHMLKFKEGRYTVEYKNIPEITLNDLIYVEEIDISKKHEIDFNYNFPFYDLNANKLILNDDGNKHSFKFYDIEHPGLKAIAIFSFIPFDNCEKAYTGYLPNGDRVLLYINALATNTSISAHNIQIVFRQNGNIEVAYPNVSNQAVYEFLNKNYHYINYFNSFEKDYKHYSFEDYYSYKYGNDKIMLFKNGNNGFIFKRNYYGTVYVNFNQLALDNTKSCYFKYTTDKGQKIDGHITPSIEAAEFHNVNPNKPFYLHPISTYSFKDFNCNWNQDGFKKDTTTLSVKNAITLTFELSTKKDAKYHIKIKEPSNGRIITIPNNDSLHNIKEGTEVTLTAIPDTGYKFAGWKGISSLSDNIKFTVSKNMTISADFLPDKNKVCLEVGNNGFVIDHNQNTFYQGIHHLEYNKDDNIKFIAVGSYSYKLSKWEGDISKNQQNNSVVFLNNKNEENSICVSFEKINAIAKGTWELYDSDPNGEIIKLDDGTIQLKSEGIQPYDTGYAYIPAGGIVKNIKYIEFKAKFHGKYKIYFLCDTSLGTRYFCYSGDTPENFDNGEYFNYTLDSHTMNNTWFTERRDLTEDLQKAIDHLGINQEAIIYNLKKVIIRGDACIDYINFITDNEDLDGDHIPDKFELEQKEKFGIPLSKNNPYDAYEDFDGDGLTNFEEYKAGTRLDIADTDSDGLSDYDELNHTLTNPCTKDTDGNGIPDGQEDFDRDGVRNIDETPESIYSLPANKKEYQEEVYWDMYDASPIGSFNLIQEPNIIYNNIIMSFDNNIAGKGFDTAYRYTPPYNFIKGYKVNWTMKTSEYYKIYFYVNTTIGDKYICYTPDMLDNLYNCDGLEAVYGLGNKTLNNEWINVKRDLLRDINNAYPDIYVHINCIHYIIIRMNGYIDEIYFFDKEKE